MTEDNFVFIDTNVLVHAGLTSSPFREEARKALLNLTAQGYELWISDQILREYVAVVTRSQSFSLPVPVETAIHDLRQFLTQYRLAYSSAGLDVWLTLLQQHQVHGKQVHDANIVATMIVNHIPRLVTQNVTDFSRYSSRIEMLSLEQAAEARIA